MSPGVVDPCHPVKLKSHSRNVDRCAFDIIFSFGGDNFVCCTASTMMVSFM